jgi:hypothetical protein
MRPTPLLLLGSRVVPPAPCLLPVAISALLSSSCGEPLPSIPLDLSSHDRCGTSVPYVVDASASEIQCLAEDYIYATYVDEEDPIIEDGINVPSPPACCEVCARKDSADEACQAMCKHDLCARAYDAHYAAGQELEACTLPSCGFDLTMCLEEGPHFQWLELRNDQGAEVNVAYGLWTECTSSAADPVRPDGLFRYLEGLGTVPGAGGGLANVEDVVAYCEDKLPDATGVATTLVGDAGDDSTGMAASDAGSDGDPSEPPPRPRACGPYAEERLWVRPTNNFGVWNNQSAGVGVQKAASHPVTVSGGGIAYTLLPCEGRSDAQCLRIDQLSAELSDPELGLAMVIALLEHSELIPMSNDGHIDIRPGALRLAVRYEHDGKETLAMATNDKWGSGLVDALEGHLHLTGISASSDDGTASATMSLHADLLNTQPSAEIVWSIGAGGNRVSLSAVTSDAEHDPIVHHWVIPSVGTWTGDDIEVALPVGRHPVILYADDVHRSRGVAATWVVINPVGA